MVARAAGVPASEVTRLRELVKERGIESVSSLTGFPKSSISRWVNGVCRPTAASIFCLRARLQGEKPLMRADNYVDRFHVEPDRLKPPTLGS